MKVLWLTESPSLAAAALNIPVVGRGWIESLELRIKERSDVELGVAFIHGESKVNKFDDRGTTYYAIPNKKGRIEGHIDRHFTRLRDEKLLNYCLEVINDFQPDVIQVFGTEDAFGLIAGRTNIPVVIHLQGLLTIYERKWYPPGITKYDLLRCTPLWELLRANTLLHNYTYYKKTADRERKVFSTGKYFIGRTDWDKRVCKVLAPEATYFFGSEMLRKAFYEHQWAPKKREEKIIVSTIQANIYKGLETVLETAVLLKEKMGVAVKWYIAGIAETDIIVKVFERKMKKRFRDYHVILSGRLKPEELLKLELDADVFVHPSHIDNSPNSVCEAMLLGMPIVATFTGGTGSLLADRKEGLLIQDGDPYAMAGAIWDMINDLFLAAELGRNARQRAKERHDPNSIVENLIRIYKSIAKISE